MIIIKKISRSLWQWYKDEPAVVNENIADFPADDNNSALFKFKPKLTSWNRFAKF